MISYDQTCVCNFSRKRDVRSVMILLNDDFNLEENGFQNVLKEARRERLFKGDAIKLFLSNNRVEIALKIQLRRGWRRWVEVVIRWVRSWNLSVVCDYI